jgi:hypothetical protein
LKSRPVHWDKIYQSTHFKGKLHKLPINCMYYTSICNIQCMYYTSVCNIKCMYYTSSVT